MSGLPRAIYDGTASCATCVLWRLDESGPPPFKDTGTCYADMSGMRTVLVAEDEGHGHVR